MKCKLFTFLILLLPVVTCSAQSLISTTGFLNTPSAEMKKEGTFYMGVNHLNKINFKNLSMINEEAGWQEGDFQIFYFDLTLFSFLEINFRNNYKDFVNKSTGKSGKQIDRNINVKLRPIKESVYLPAIAIGGNDVRGNGYEQAYYVAATKHFDCQGEQFVVNLGYAYSPERFYNRSMNGVFGGIAYTPSFCKSVRLMTEYDSNYFNIGASFCFLKHFQLLAAFQDLDRFSGGVSYSFRIPY